MMTQQIERSARKTDHPALVDVLNDAVGTEIVCWLRYSRHADSLSGLGSEHVCAAFYRYAEQELRHAIRAAERVSQCGGKPNFAPSTQASHVETAYGMPENADAAGMLRENLAAERTMILAYREIIRRVGGRDPATRRLLESLLAEHEHHADDLRSLLGHSNTPQEARWRRGSSPLEDSTLLERPAC
ncbi:MAG: bacterioferritin [Streptosporangiaceae bacterium]|nr:bacterioferritin [Streptosporangiaceae bacterium]MBV9854938.1 bacterioferritin [Streptosporangiaceae bacterium]